VETNTSLYIVSKEPTYEVLFLLSYTTAFLCFSFLFILINRHLKKVNKYHLLKWKFVGLFLLMFSVAVILGEKRCVTTQITAAEETMFLGDHMTFKGIFKVDYIADQHQHFY